MIKVRKPGVAETRCTLEPLPSGPSWKERWHGATALLGVGAPRRDARRVVGRIDLLNLHHATATGPSGTEILPL